MVWPNAWESPPPENTKTSFENPSGRGRLVGGGEREVTGRKQTSETLQESKALHRVLMEQALEGLIIAQGNPTRIVLANKAMANLTGYGIDELISFAREQLQRLVHPDDRKIFFQRFRDRLRGKKVPEHYEFRGIRKDGSLTWLAATSVRITHRGKPAVLALFTDVTERKQAEQAAEKERDRLFSVLDVMPAFVYLQSSDYSVPFVNRRFSELFGDPGNTPCYRAFYGRKRPCDPCITLRVLGTKAPQTWEWVSREGKVYMVHEDLFHGSDGREMVLGIGVDITDTKQAEQELQDRKERYRSLFEDSPISIWEEDFSRVKKYIDRLRSSGVIDFDAYFRRHPQSVVKCAGLVKVVDVNKASLQLYGAKDKKELTSGLSKLLVKESYRPFREELVSIAQGKTVFENEGITKNLQGELKHVVLRWIVAPGYEETWARVLVTIVNITQRKEMEEALRRERDFTRSILRTANGMIFCLDGEGRVTVFNDECERVTGYRREDVLGKKWADIFLPPEKRHLGLKSFGQWVRAHPQDRYEGPVVTRSGEIRTILWSNSSIIGPRRSDVTAIAVGNDVTERKKAEQALQENEEKYRLLVNNITDMIVNFDTQGRLLFVSPSYLKTFGKSEEQILGKKFMPLIHKDDRAYVQKTLAETYRPPHTVYLEERAKTVNGWRWQAWVNTAVLDQEGRVAYVVAVGRDITLRKQAEEALRKQEEKHRTLVETAQEGIIQTDAKGNLVFVNQAFADFLGYGKDELLGRSLKDFVEESQDHLVTGEANAKGPRVTSKYEIVLLAKSGKPRPVYVSAVPMTGEDGKSTGTLSVMTDLSEIKKAQEYDVLLNASRALARSLNADQVLQVGAERLAQTLGADRCTVMLFHDKTTSGSGATLRTYALSGRAGHGRVRTSALKAGEGLLSSYRRALQARRGIQVSLVRGDSSPQLARRVLRQSGMVSALIVPVFQRNRLLAVFHVGTTRKSVAFARDRVKLALTMANQVGAALQNCKLLEDVRREHLRATEQTKLLKGQYREQRMMFELVQLLTSTRSLDQLLKSAVKKVVQLLRTERASMMLSDADGRNATIRAVYPQTSERNRRALGHVLTAGTYPQEWKRVITENLPFVCPDVSALPKNTPAAKYLRSRGIRSTVAMPLVSRGKNLGFLTVSTTEKTHEYTPEEIRLLRAISDPVAVTIENYQLLEDLQHKYDQIDEQATKLKKQTREKDILLRVSQALSKAMSAEQVSRAASEVVAAAVGADRCAVMLAGPDTGTLEVRALFSNDGSPTRKIVGLRLSAGESRNFRESIGKGKTLVLRQPGRTPDIDQAKRHWLRAGIKSTLAAGMFFGQTLVGVLSVSFTREDRDFTKDESKLIRAIASQVAIALENARLLEEVERHGKNVRRLAAELMNAQESARKDIAQELHDHEGQMLLAMKMNLDRMQRDLSARPDHPKATAELLSDTRELLAQTIEEIRTLTFELRPPILEDFGLVPALKWLLDRFARRSEIQYSLKTKGKERRYYKEIEVALFRIAQEALANASKHARATEVSILVSHQAPGIVMSVRDNGVGFDVKKKMSTPRGEMGLLNIKERVSLLGGKLEIISQPRKGTTLNINIPSSEVKHEEDQVVGR
jgi:PAS domain S-box-containing protein